MALFFLPPLSAAPAATTAFPPAFSSITGTAAATLLLLGSLRGGTLTAGSWLAGRPRRGVGSLGGEKGAALRVDGGQGGGAA